MRTAGERVECPYCKARLWLRKDGCLPRHSRRWELAKRCPLEGRPYRKPGEVTETPGA